MVTLDTNSVLYVLKGKGRVAERLLATLRTEVTVPAVVVCELEGGTLKSGSPDRREPRQHLLTSPGMPRWRSPPSRPEFHVMALEHRWTRLDSDEMRSFAVRWLRSLQGDSPDEEVGQAVVMLGFIAPADQQWEFLVAAVDNSTTDEQLGHIAAGPAECLLSRKGKESIAWFEERASSDRRFARMLTGVWRHLMTDDVWQRVQTLQAAVDDRL